MHYVYMNDEQQRDVEALKHSLANGTYLEMTLLIEKHKDPHLALSIGVSGLMSAMLQVLGQYELTLLDSVNMERHRKFGNAVKDILDDYITAIGTQKAGGDN